MATASVHQTYQTPVTCGMCESSKEVNWYCPDCKGNLCDTCQVSHAQIPMFRKHNVIPILEGLRLQAAEENCSRHTSYVCSFHCNTCHKPVCNKCITSDHRGHDINEIETALQKIRQEIQEYRRTLETRYLAQCKSEEAKIKQNLAEYKKVTNSIKSSINKQSEEMITEILRLRDDLISRVEEEEKHYISDLKKATRKLQDTTKEIELLMSTSKEALKKITSDLITFNQDKPSITQLDVPKAPIIQNKSFQAGTINKAQLAVQLGNLVSPTIPQIDVSILYRNKLDSGIRSVKAVDGHHAWVRVQNNHQELRLVNTDGEVLKCISQKSNIQDFTVTTSDDIITTNYLDRCISIITQTGQVTNTINTYPNLPSGVCVGNKNQDIVVCVTTPDRSSCKLMVYNRDGKERETINYTDKPVGGYGEQRVTQNNRGDYCVAHWGHKKVYVMDSNGALRYTYDGSGAGKMKEKFDLYDISSDIYNHLFISDFKNHKIHMLDDEGKFLRFILTEQDGITKPTGLCIDKDGRLWVGDYNSGLCVVKYLK